MANPFGNDPDPESQNWRTPPALFQALHSIFRFEVDAAADETNHLLPAYWSAHPNPRFSGPGGPVWVGKRVWCNPPWSMTDEFIWAGRNTAVAVYLISANSLPSAYVAKYPPLLIVYPPYRVKYLHPDRDEPSNPAHGSAILIYGSAVDVDEVVPQLAKIGTVYRLAARYSPDK